MTEILPFSLFFWNKHGSMPIFVRCKYKDRKKIKEIMYKLLGIGE